MIAQARRAAARVLECGRSATLIFVRWRCAHGASSNQRLSRVSTRRAADGARVSGPKPPSPAVCPRIQQALRYASWRSIPETGALDITRYHVVDDVGQPINPLIVHGQVHGGIVQGLGQALVGDTRRRPTPPASSTTPCRPPHAAAVPFALVEDPTSGNPLRVKGGGESGITPCLAAVVNAAADALAPLGVTEVAMPATPSRVWEAIRNAQREGGTS